MFSRVKKYVTKFLEKMISLIGKCHHAPPLSTDLLIGQSLQYICDDWMDYRFFKTFFAFFVS